MASTPREQLFEAARRSQACADLADDDHGPLALQEIVLAGCPAVSVRTGAPFIQDGVTGVFVDRLPPGGKCVKNDTDEAALAAFHEAVRVALDVDRQKVWLTASAKFGTATIVELIKAMLADTRRHVGAVGNWNNS